MANMATSKPNGTVTALSSIFPAEEAVKASKLVQKTIADRQRQLDEVRTFIADNDNLINLVQRLPDELHHDIMVPFGKAAFFPGRLLHTNEFLVFIGVGYYVERTSKQTVDILKRRRKSLESQVDSLEAMMKDLKSEASFFETTAAEAAEGLVEIREDHIDEDSSKVGFQKKDEPHVSGAGQASGQLDDKEYARMMSRLDELEEEELAAEALEEVKEDEADLDLRHLEYELRDSKEYEDSRVKIESFQHGQKGVHSGEKVLHHSTGDKSPEVSTTQVHTSFEAILGSKEEVPYRKTKPDTAHLTSEPVPDSLKAFSGSIIERSNNLPNNPVQQNTPQPSGAQSSKPVSRFKMLRR